MKLESRGHYDEGELKEALRAIVSTISKCERALPKFERDTSQHTLLTRRIKAFHIAAELIERELADKTG